MKTNTNFWSYIARVLKWKMFQTKNVEKIKIYFMFNYFLPPPPESRAVYEIMWKNILGPDRPQMTICMLDN